VPSILQVNSSDIGGGAEQVAIGLHRRFQAIGEVAHLTVGKKWCSEPG
jgi:hypothetical protein